MNAQATQVTAMPLPSVGDAEALYRAGDALGALAILESHLAMGSTLARPGWPLFFASMAKVGRPIELGHFRTARDESLLPFLLLNRSAAEQVALLTDIIPSLTDLTTLHLATDVWCARVPSMDRTEALAAVDKAKEWLSPDDCSRVLAALGSATSATEPTSSSHSRIPECANQSGALDGGSQEGRTVSVSRGAAHLPKWLAHLAAWANIIHRRMTALSLPQSSIIVLAIVLIALRRLSAFVPQILRFRTILERLIQIV
ncbi:hypothetical protein BCR44DRAFT_72575 [Catenaria anguillulae PL171]|uniref:Uncharacterized protein n=1 Tax=Catenaria anguillulae PL171 TaxID=765915 RepID=A0A1Y2HV15_9FUNG|nr:hypothetical protein BCR44DRAFT_72575 [Catenaria anguillulae PL171]